MTDYVQSGSSKYGSIKSELQAKGKVPTKKMNNSNLRLDVAIALAVSSLLALTIVFMVK